MKKISPRLFLFLALPLLFSACTKEEVSEYESSKKNTTQEERSLKESKRHEQGREEKHEQGKKNENAKQDTTPTESTTPTTSSASDATQQQSKTVSYASPGGEDTVTFEIATKDGKIVSVAGSDVKVHHESAQYNRRFYSAISAKVAGKTLEEAKNIGIVAGASLTSKAFEKAVSGL